MKIFDVTVAVSENVPIYSGDPSVAVSSFMSMANGDAANVSEIRLGAHTATHVDAPNHFIDGARRVHELDPHRLIGPCRVIEIDKSVVAIEPGHLGSIGNAERVLFKTRNSAFWSEPETGFRSDFTYITLDTAKMLVERGIVLVGIDYLSIEKSGAPGHPVHIALLEKEVVILEGLDLRGIEPGDYEIICLPFKYEGGGGDGAPARTFLKLAE